MKKITQKEYIKAVLRLEKLLELEKCAEFESVTHNLELIEVSDIIEAYLEAHLPVGLPSLVEVVELRMFELGLKRKDLALLLYTSASRISEYLNGKREITLEVAKGLHKKLNIDSDIILQ